MNYEHTHYSISDFSPAMFVSEDNEANTYVLVNEDGFQFTVSQDDWISFVEAEQEEYEDHYSQSGEEYMANYLNSDSNLIYLNSH